MAPATKHAKLKPSAESFSGGPDRTPPPVIDNEEFTSLIKDLVRIVEAHQFTGPRSRAMRHRLARYDLCLRT